MNVLLKISAWKNRQTESSVITGAYIDTLQKVRGLKSAVRAYDAREFPPRDHAHIGDKESPPLDDKLFFSVLHQK